MRVAADRLIFLALAALEAERARARAGPVTPLLTTRLALAVLFSFSRSGERANYDGFWQELQAPHENAFTDAIGNTLRSVHLHSYIEWIIRDVGAPGDIAYRDALYELVSGPLPHPLRPSGARTRAEDAGDAD
jgi:hypothetical protein